MIDYDEMNEVLGREEQGLAKEAERKTDAWQNNPYADTPEPENESSGYDIYYSIIESVRDKLNVSLECARRNYDGIDKMRDNAKNDMLGMVFGFLFHLAGYPIIFMLLSGYHILALVAFSALGFFWAVYTFRFAKKTGDEIASYITRCEKEPVSGAAKALRILTFERERDFYLGQIREVKERMKKVDLYENRLKRNGVFEERHCEELRALARMPKDTPEYSNTKVTMAECLRYHFAKQENTEA